jgi:hypothetical protein
MSTRGTRSSQKMTPSSPVRSVSNNPAELLPTAKETSTEATTNAARAMMRAVRLPVSAP